MDMVEWKDFAQKYADKCRNHDVISEELFDRYGVKRGLRDKNGAGVVTGLTNISRIDAFKMKDGKKTPCDGELRYRGYNICDLVEGIHGRRYGYEEIAYLILFGELPSEADLNFFIDILSRCRRLPTNFTRDVIMKGPTGDLMNSMTRSVLTLASYVDNPHDTSLENVLIQCIQLISEFPMLAVYSYHAYNHYVRDDSLYIHRPDPNLSTAENILMMLRPDKKFTAVEAMVLDIALILHMEHGGGNNSTFTTRVVTSAGSDTYSVIAAALSSLKGPRHGGANAKVVEMMRHIRDNVSDITDEDEVRDYLGRILMGEAFDGKGLIYGMGHAIYSKSDPRANIFRGFVKRLAEEKDRKDVFDFYSMVERLAPEVIADKRRIYKGVSANVDFYSGFVYSMLDIPVELFTPMFAMARIVGWSAHRLEELVNADKIIRPAYTSVVTDRDYIPIEERKDTHV